MKRRLARVAFLVLLLAAFSRQAPGALPRHRFLWRVSSPSTSIYLLGSIHVLDADAGTLGAAVDASFAAARTLVFEVDMDRMAEAGMKLLAAGTLRDGVALADVVAPETYRLACGRLRGLGLDPDAFARMRPWMVAMTLSAFELTRAGYSQEDGVDAQLFARAKEAGKERKALETVDYQVSLFADMDGVESEAFLRETLHELDALIPQVRELTAAWRRGDVSTVTRLLEEGYQEYPDLFARMVTARNRSWLPRLEELLAGREPALVVVGALHLVGDDGILELLRRQGYSVEQMEEIER